MKKQARIILCTLMCVSYSVLNAIPSLSLVTGKRFSNGKVNSLNWHTSGTTDYIVYGGKNDSHKDMRIAKLEYEDSSIELEVKTKINFSDDEATSVNAVAWTHSGPRRLAIGGNINNEGHEIKVYDYDDGHLEKKSSADMPQVNGLDWLRFNNLSYLAVAGFNDKDGSEVRVYSYINDDLLLLPNATAEYFHGEANSVKWLVDGSNIYLAVGGFELGASTDTNVRVYGFNPITDTLTLITSMPFSFDYVYSVSWIVNGVNMYLAATGHDGATNNETRIYGFNGTTLTLITQQTFNHGSVYASDWLTFGGVMYLAICGDDGSNGQEVRIYSFNGTTLTLVTSLALITETAVTLEWKISDGIPYLAIGNDGDLALLLYSFSAV